MELNLFSNICINIYVEIVLMPIELIGVQEAAEYENSNTNGFIGNLLYIGYIEEILSKRVY